MKGAGARHRRDISMVVVPTGATVLVENVDRDRQTVDLSIVDRSIEYPIGGHRVVVALDSGQLDWLVGIHLDDWVEVNEAAGRVLNRKVIDGLDRQTDGGSARYRA